MSRTPVFVCIHCGASTLPMAYIALRVVGVGMGPDRMNLNIPVGHVCSRECLKQALVNLNADALDSSIRAVIPPSLVVHGSAHRILAGDGGGKGREAAKEQPLVCTASKADFFNGEPTVALTGSPMTGDVPASRVAGSSPPVSHRAGGSALATLTRQTVAPLPRRAASARRGEGAGGMGRFLASRRRAFSCHGTDN